jgi:hypothetical protein
MALPYVWTFWHLDANACAYLVKVILDEQGLLMRLLLDASVILLISGDGLILQDGCS